MAYKQIEILEPLLSFVKSCPFLNANEISIGEIEVSYQDANAIAYSGTPEPIISKGIYADATVTKQANFVLYLKRPRYDDFVRRVATEFLINFENWVEGEDLTGNPPRIGDYPEDERIWADNGTFYGASDEQSTAPEYGVYQIQIHIRYKLNYAAS